MKMGVVAFGTWRDMSGFVKVQFVPALVTHQSTDPGQLTSVVWRKRRLLLYLQELQRSFVCCL